MSMIESAISDLPDQPTLAAGKLELAWELVLGDLLPLHDQDSQETPTPTPWDTITPTPTPN